MTTEAKTAGGEAWQQALTRFEALLLLFEADDQWGPLAIATSAAESSHSLARMTGGAEKDEWNAAYRAATAANEAELERHMATIWNPMIAAGLALVRIPAPDLAAARIKHGIINHPSGCNLLDYEDEEGELFGILRADIARLTGIVA